MKRLAALACIYLLLVGVARANDPMTLTFDEVSLAPGGYVGVQNGYGGLQWSNFLSFNVSGFVATSGYRTGLISPENIAFNGSGEPAAISRSAGFTLHSAYLTSAHVVHTHIRVQGSVGTNVAYDNVYVVSNTAPALIHFNYVGVDRVIFVSSPETQFAMDNLTVTTPSPDESCTFAVSPRRRLHGPGSEMGTVSVHTQPGCNWSVVNTNPWVTILSNPNNVGSGTVTYALAGDLAGARSGFITIAGQNFEVRQSVESIIGTELTFDDVLPGRIDPAYGGLRWNNFGVLDGLARPVTSGYRIGVISAYNIAYNQSGDPASIRSDTVFGLRSAYLTAALDLRVGFREMRLRVQGFMGGTLIYDNLHTISNNAPALIEFDSRPVDEVQFIPPQHSTIFAMDNLVVVLDSDGDGVLDHEDQCPDTERGTAVTAHGCSIEQLVPCAGPVTGGAWRNHAQYVKTLTAAADAFYREGLIGADERRATVQAAKRSDCGKH